MPGRVSEQRSHDFLDLVADLSINEDAPERFASLDVVPYAFYDAIFLSESWEWCIPSATGRQVVSTLGRGGRSGSAVIDPRDVT